MPIAFLKGLRFRRKIATSSGISRKRQDVEKVIVENVIPAMNIRDHGFSSFNESVIYMRFMLCTMINRDVSIIPQIITYTEDIATLSHNSALIKKFLNRIFKYFRKTAIWVKRFIFKIFLIVVFMPY